MLHTLMEVIEAAGDDLPALSIALRDLSPEPGEEPGG